MTNSSCLIELKHATPRTAWAQVIPALRQDTLIWNALQNPDFRELAISKLGGNSQIWTPAHLSLLSIKIDLNPEALRSTSISELDPELRIQAIQTYELYSSESPPEMTLATAGLLALSLHEHHRLTHSWQKIPLSTHWHTPYACLYQLVEQPMLFLNRLPVPLIIHTILANPLTPEDQIEAFLSISTTLTTHQRLAMLRVLGYHRPDLTRIFALKLWKGNQEISNRARYSDNLYGDFRCSGDYGGDSVP